MTQRRWWPRITPADRVPDLVAKAAGVVACGALLGWWLRTLFWGDAMTTDTHDDPQSVLGRYLLPALGVVALLFTLVTGVPWVSRGEFALYREGRDIQWRAQYEHNARTEKATDQLERIHDLLSAEIAEVRANQRQVQEILHITPSGSVGRKRER